MAVDNERDIFWEALDCETAEARDLLLARRCGDNRLLRQSVQQLLDAHQHTSPLDDNESPDRLRRQLLAAASVMQGETRGLEDADPCQSLRREADRSGEVLGSYRLRELLGEGGFGQVYVAEQCQPVRRRVAIKLLKPGMDSREVLARFEGERQALAMMNHPHIAQVFDAGTTELGQPYLVMELVRGQAITHFCRQQNLDVRQIVGLMIDVCQAVGHAHQKGIIHRDLKPSNVLVAMDDTIPIVKVIDFGIAKAMDRPLTERTIYTHFTQLLGTPMYMSPEQAEMKAREVDTLSDIYALGVLLYELLTGNTPFDKVKLQTASFDEMRRIIREVQPPRPSVRVTSAVHARALPATPAATAARATGLVPELTRDRARQLRGDLDWVVLKAMEKDRRRRYETAAALARDLERYLAGLPVLARSPSRWYTATRFCARHRWLVLSIGLVVVSLLVGSAVSLRLAILAQRASNEADRLRVEALQSVANLREANILLDSARANMDQGRLAAAWRQYSLATELQPEHYLTWAGRGQLYAQSGLWDEAAVDYGRAIDLGAPANNPSWWGVPHLLLYHGDQALLDRLQESFWQQLSRSEDHAQVMAAARGLCLQPLPPADAQRILSRLEELNILDRAQRSPGRPARNGAGPPRLRPGGRGPGPLGRGFGPPFGERPGPNFSAGMPREMVFAITALVALRAGQEAQAIHWLSQPPFRGEAPLLTSPLLSLAYQQQGDETRARAELEHAMTAHQAWAADIQEASPRVPWFDGLEAYLLLNEAHQALEGRPFPVDESIRHWQQNQWEELLTGLESKL